MTARITLYARLVVKMLRVIPDTEKVTLIEAVHAEVRASSFGMSTPSHHLYLSRASKIDESHL